MLATLLFAFREADLSLLLSWGLVVCLLTLLQGLCVHTYFKHRERLPIEWWPRLLLVTSGMLGLTFGMGAYFFINFSDAMQVILVTLFLLAPTYGSTAFTAAYFPVHLTWCITTTIPLAVTLLLSHIDDMALLGGAILIAATPSAIVLGWMASREFREALLTRIENERLVSDLREQKQLAEHASMEKSRFLAAVSHDLRQPLHALDLFHSSLKSRLEDGEQQRLLGLASHSSHELGEMLGELMDVARFDAGVIVPKKRIVPLAPLLRECADEVRPLADENGLDLRIRLPRKGCVKTDPVLFKRILRNLLSNAIRHSESGGVLVGTRMREGQIDIEVYDTGPGISEGELPYIFDEFYQIDNPERDREKGLGLGLAIVRRVSKVLGHCIAVRSRPGHGSCFSVSMPLCAIANQCQPGDADEFMHVADLSGLFVIVVDDDRSILQGMRELLLGWGCEVLLAESEVELLEELAAHDYPLPDVLVSDYRLRKGQTGLQLVDAVRGRFGSEIPALIISGDVHPDALASVKQAGCHWLEKPVQDDELKRTLAELARSEAGDS